MHIVPLALFLQESTTQTAAVAEAAPRVGSALEGSIALAIYALPVLLAALAAVAPRKSRQYRIYPMLLPTFLGSIFIGMAFGGRQFFSGYLLGGGFPGAYGVTGQESMIFTMSTLVTLTAFGSATYTCILAGIAAFRAQGLAAALAWAPLLVAVRLMLNGTESIFLLFAKDPTEGKLEKVDVALSQMEAWGDQPTWIALCLLGFLVLHYFGTKTDKLCS